MEVIILLISLIFVYYNKYILSFWIIELGFIFNTFVMILNNGKMPCVNNLNIQFDIRHTIITNTTRLKLLSDIIYLPYPLNILAKLYSIGDIIIAIGLMLLIKEIYKNKLKLF